MSELYYWSKNQPVARWLRLALFNFVVVAAAGVLVRYKVTFPLPAVEFKNLLHAHSHFAFSGWISLALFVLIMAGFIPRQEHEKKKYKRLIWLSQLTSYGMLVSFFLQEYGPVSIGFSTAYIFVTYGFAIAIWRSTRGEKHRLSVQSLRAALIFLVVSSFGPYTLAYVKAAHLMNAELYHNSIYWYLHFQYNGWFSFAVFALLIRQYEDNLQVERRLRLPFYLLLAACVPAYVLSVIWTLPPLWVYVLGGLAAGAQVMALLVAVKPLFEERIDNHSQPMIVKSLFVLAGAAFGIKILLQLLSVFPQLNQFVFGHRPVIIGYLHLVLLGFISFYLIGHSIKRGILFCAGQQARIGLWTLVLGVLLSETGLLFQGFSGVLNEPMKWTPEFIFIASVLMFLGLALFSGAQLASKHPGSHPQGEAGAYH